MYALASYEEYKDKVSDDATQYFSAILGHSGEDVTRYYMTYKKTRRNKIGNNEPEEDSKVIQEVLGKLDEQEKVIESHDEKIVNIDRAIGNNLNSNDSSIFRATRRVQSAAESKKYEDALDAIRKVRAEEGMNNNITIKLIQKYIDENATDPDNKPGRDIIRNVLNLMRLFNSKEMCIEATRKKKQADAKKYELAREVVRKMHANNERISYRTVKGRLHEVDVGRTIILNVIRDVKRL